MAGIYGEGSTGDKSYIMEIEGSRNGRMGECNYDGKGRQRVLEPKS